MGVIGPGVVEKGVERRSLDQEERGYLYITTQVLGLAGAVGIRANCCLCGKCLVELKAESVKVRLVGVLVG